MFRFLIITSACPLAGNISLNSLKQQINVLKQPGIEIDLLIDPSLIELERALISGDYHCALSTTMFSFETSNFNKPRKRNFIVQQIFEQFEQEYIGSDAFTQLLVNDKTISATRSGIGLMGILISRAMLGDDLESLLRQKFSESSYPIIVKPNTLSCSLGITSASVVDNCTALVHQIHDLFNKIPSLDEIRAEKFMQSAREFTVSVLGNNHSKVYSVSELIFQENPTVQLFGETEKLTSLKNRPVKYKALSLNKENKLRSDLIFHASRLFDFFGMRDMARFDFVYDSRAYLIDINAMPVTGNSFSWEWQEKYNFNKENGIALLLAAFFYRKTISGTPLPLPNNIFSIIPNHIKSNLAFAMPTGGVPESSPPSNFCQKSNMYKMVDRVSSEIEVIFFLKALVILLKPKLIIETGTHKGATTVSLSQGIQFNNYGKLITIENDSTIYNKVKKDLEALPVTVVFSNSLEYHPTEEIDLLFLDSHRPIRIKEFSHFLPYLAKNAIVVWHDSSPDQGLGLVFKDLEKLEAKKIISKIDLNTPRGLTISKLVNQHNYC